jgi:hypothetical protein
MVSRPWTSLIHILIALLLAGSYQGILTSPVQAEDEDTCQSAYGKTPEQIPGWLEPASTSMDLTTNHRYDLLAGKLLSTGLVDGSTCPAMGLDSAGVPNGCGFTLTRDSVFTWQNLYNEPILRISQQEHIPPKVVKALIGVESQFWPGADWRSGEIGLAQLTGAGADMILLNRPSYYARVCIQVFGNDGCTGPYLSQTGSTKQLLIGQVLQNSNAICTSCAGGVDIERGELAIQALEEALHASCSQVSRTFLQITGKLPVDFVSYEDFWRLVLANYHSGAGCIYNAIQRTNNPSSWNSISAQVSAGCSSGRTYIHRIELQMLP